MGQDRDGTVRNDVAPADELADEDGLPVPVRDRKVAVHGVSRGRTLTLFTEVELAVIASQGDQ